MTTVSPKPRRLTLLERATETAGPCRACERLKRADEEGWEACDYCDVNPYEIKKITTKETR